MDVDEAAAQVYSAPLADFVTTRDALAKQAEDRGVAARIRNLRKPTVPAWVANQLARQHADEIEQLVQTGVDMRTATADPAQHHHRSRPWRGMWPNGPVEDDQPDGPASRSDR